MLDISIIVPVYNHWDIISELLICIENQSFCKTKFELILIDNGSDWIPADLKLPEFARLFHCAIPGSYAARNIGITHAKGNLLAFTDADCRPHTEWLATGLRTLSAAKTPKNIISGGIRIAPQNWQSLTFSEMYDIALGLPQERYARHGYGITANLFIPKTLFEDVGTFDATRFSGGDAEFCKRAIKTGATLIYCKEAKITHPARRTWAEIVTKKRRVKGGQILNGPILQRIQYGIRTVLPPARAWVYIAKSSNLSVKNRFIVFSLQTTLWFIELHELFKLLCGNKPVRE